MDSELAKSNDIYWNSNDIYWNQQLRCDEEFLFIYLFIYVIFFFFWGGGACFQRTRSESNAVAKCPAAGPQSQIE